MPKYLRARAPHDDSEARKIRRLAGARHAPGDWIERARIVALSWDGLAVPAIAARAGCHQNTVRRWLHRFNAAGLVRIIKRKLKKIQYRPHLIDGCLAATGLRIEPW